jgi:hypothetical protein
MTLIMDKKGNIINDTDESIEQLEKEYKLTEDSLEPLMFGDAEPEDFEDDINIDDEEILKMADISVEDVDMMEVGIIYSELLSILKDKFDDTEDIDDELRIIEEFLSGHGVEVSVEMGDDVEYEEEEDEEYDEDEYPDEEEEEEEDDDDEGDED